MNSAIKKTKKLIWPLIVLGICSAMLGSCSKRDQAEVSEKGETTLIFQIDGIDEGTVAVAKLGVPIGKTNETALHPVALDKEKLVTTPTVDALVSMEVIKTQGMSAKKAVVRDAVDTLNKTAVAPKAALTLMPSGIKYRLMVYDQTSTTLIKDVEAVSGTNPNIQVDGGTTYRWIAVSINEATLPTISNNTISAAALANKDVIYASGVITATKGQNYLNITFQRKTTRLDVDIDSRGIFGGITNFESLDIGTGTGANFTSLIRSANLNILTGTWSGHTAVTPTANVSHITNKNTATDNFVKTLSVYTVIPTGTTIAANSLTLKPIFQIAMDPHVHFLPTNTNVKTRTYGDNNTYLTFNNASFMPLAGDQYRLAARMIESPLRVAGISWARADLYYDSRSGALDRYKFRPDAGSIHWIDNSNAMDTEKNGYWNWMSLTPTGTPGSGDPCALVYPAGLWRMPNLDEMTTLANRKSSLYQWAVTKEQNYINSIYGYSGANQMWALDELQSASYGKFNDYSDHFMLMFNGYRNLNGALASSRMTLYHKVKATSTGGNRDVYVYMYYLTSAENGNLGRVLSQRATVSYFDSVTPDLPWQHSSTKLVSLTTREVASLNKLQGFNVRCVRAQ
ncbi:MULTISPECIES: hypothetical protein [unclassified Sphingobacterium]|uniref:hypothetical protein n=1 Tax=unclassified Sphingobacterium TaxID=2609468 RepID=UPI0025ECEC21|nr:MULTISPECIES: hypothetical protein [unclassified Sphingobacterium]